MCANGIKIRLRTGNFSFAITTLTDPQKTASIAARLIVAVPKQMQTNIQRNTRKLFAAPPTLNSRAKPIVQLMAKLPKQILSSQIILLDLIYYALWSINR